MMTSCLKGTHLCHLLYDESSNGTVYLRECLGGDDLCHVVHGKPVAVIFKFLHKEDTQDIMIITTVHTANNSIPLSCTWLPWQSA